MKKAFLLVVAVLMITVMAVAASAAGHFNGPDGMVANMGVSVADGVITYTINSFTINGVDGTGLILVLDDGTEIAPNADGKWVLSSPATEPITISHYTAPVEMFRLEQNPGVEYDIISAVPNADGTYDLAIEITVKKDYMIEDKDLHDNKIPQLYVARTVYDSATSTAKEVEITANKDGYYTFANFSLEDNFIVDCVTPIVINLDEKIEEGANLVLEADGHIYVIGAIANYGKITIVNGKTDYTKVCDGAYVDAKGHIQDPYKATTSYWANVRFADAATAAKNFYNYGTIETVFATGVDGATRNYELNLGYSANVYNYGLLEFNGNVTWTFAPVASWNNSKARFEVSNSADFFNEGTIKVTSAGPINYTSTVKLVGTFEDYVGYRLRYYQDYDANMCPDLINNGKIETFAANLTAACGFTNSGEVKLGGTLTVNKVFNNTGSGSIIGETAVFNNNATGVETKVAPTLKFAATTYVAYIDEGDDDFRAPVYAQHRNLGTIAIDSANGGDALVFRGTFTNAGSVSVTGTGVNVEIAGLLKNIGTFDYASATNKDSTLESKLLIRNREGAYTEQTVAGKTNLTVYPLGITNDGTMNLSGYFFQNGGGKIVNNGTMTVTFKSFTNHRDNWATEDEHPDDEDKKIIIPENATYNTIESKVVVYDGCENCPGHNKDSEFVVYDGRIFNNGTMNITKTGRMGFEKFYNAKDAVLNITDSSFFVAYIQTKDPFSKALTAFNYSSWLLDNSGKIVVDNSMIVNGGLVDNKGEIEIKSGTFYNFNDVVVAKGATIVNNGTYKNFDSANFEKVTGMDGVMEYLNDKTFYTFDPYKAFVAYTLIKGEFVNNGTFYNEYGYDVRVEGKLDNVNGKVVNKGMIVNVGTFTSTLEGIDNQFAIHGYEVDYVNKAAAETPADTTAKADNETPADTTKAPNKTPAAQTSDVAVAGFAVIATLALAGVVVAKKVR
ncbi:MAG: hypothetical protein IKT70_09540 [Clostridia bacterium]|nr:hypothetical protein [Clostridia bacterium]